MHSLTWRHHEAQELISWCFMCDMMDIPSSSSSCRQDNGTSSSGGAELKERVRRLLCSARPSVSLSCRPAQPSLARKVRATASHASSHTHPLGPTLQDGR